MKIILPIFFILISIVVFIFGVNQFYKDVSTLKEEISVYKEALDNSTKLLTTQDTLLKNYNEIKQEDKERLNNFLPGSVNNIEFILEIEHIANIHNMPIKDIKFEAMKKKITPNDPNMVVSEIPTDNRSYGVFPVEFTTEGSYDRFLDFLKDLEFNLRLVDIKSISFLVSDNKNAEVGVDPNVYTYNLKVETYWLK